MSDNTPRYFTVPVTSEIGSQRLLPGVVYPLRADIQDTIFEAAKNNKASLYAEKCRIISGVAYEPHSARRVERLPATDGPAPSPLAKAGAGPAVTRRFLDQLSFGSNTKVGTIEQRAKR